MQPARNHAGVGITVSQREALAVAVLAHEGDGGPHFAARRFPLSLPDKKQVAVLDAGHCAALLRQPHQKAGVWLVGLIDMVHSHLRHVFAHRHFELVPPGNLSHHLTNADLMPGLFALGIERLPGVRATRAQGQPVRHAAVLDFVHGVGAFQEKRFTLPAERRRQLNAPARHEQLTVRVVQFDVQLVRFKAAVIGKRQADKPLFYLLRDVRPGKRQAKSGRVRLPVNPTARHHENNPPTLPVTSVAAPCMADS